MSPKQGQAENHQTNAVKNFDHVLRHDVANGPISSHSGAHPVETNKVLLPYCGTLLHTKFVIIYNCLVLNSRLNLVPADSAPRKPYLQPIKSAQSNRKRMISTNAKDGLIYEFTS